jgi:hypothetical protein
MTILKMIIMPIDENNDDDSIFDNDAQDAADAMDDYDNNDDEEDDNFV